MGVCRRMHLGDWLVIIAVAVIDEDDCVAVSLLTNRIAYPIGVATDATTATTAAAVNAVADVWIGWHVVDAREGSAAEVVIVIVALPICLIMSHTTTTAAITAATTAAAAAATAATRACVRLLISQEHLS